MEMKLTLGQMHRTIVKEKLVAGFRLSESLYPPHLKTPVHSHQQACFSLVLSGASSQTVGRKIRERTPKTMLFYSVDESHCESFGNTGSRIFSIEMGAEWSEKLVEHSSMRRDSAVFEGGLLGWLTSRLYREFYSSDEFTTLAIEGLALEIMAEACRRKPDALSHRSPRWLVRAKDLVHSRFFEHLSLSDISSRVGVHPVYLASTFRKTFGCTIGEYVRKQRVEFAINELISSDTPLAQIAVDAGFANQAHFTRVFKRQTGMTPGEYRVTSRY